MLEWGLPEKRESFLVLLVQFLRSLKWVEGWGFVGDDRGFQVEGLGSAGDDRWFQVEGLGSAGDDRWFQVEGLGSAGDDRGFQVEKMRVQHRFAGLGNWRNSCK
jgi:hypothetical protein